MNGPTFAPAPVHVSAPPPAPRPPARPPARPAVAKPADDSAAALRVLTYLRLHWLLILFCGSLLGAGLAYAAWNLLPPKYESYAVLQAASVPTAIGGGNDPTAGRTEFTTFMKTQAQLLKFNFVLESALSDADFKIASLPTLSGQKNPIKYLDEKLDIRYTEGAETIRVLLEGDRPEDIQKIVNAVVKAYKREVIDIEARQKTALRQNVEKAKVDIEDQMKMRAQGKPDYYKGAIPPALMQASATVPSAMPGGDPGVQQAVATSAQGSAGEHEKIKKAKYSIAAAKFLQLDGEVKRFPVYIKDRKADIDQLTKQLDALKNAPPDPDVLEAADKDGDVVRLQHLAAQYERDARFLANVVGNPNGAKVAQAKQHAEGVVAEWIHLRDKKAHAAQQARNKPKEDRLREQIDKLNNELASLAEREKVARAELEDAKKDVIDMPIDPKKAAEDAALVDPLRTEMLAQDSAYQQVTAQAIRLQFEPPDRMTVRQHASAPLPKDGKKQIIGTIVAALMGFALIGLGAVVAESAVRRVSSLGELKTSLPTPVVGVIPWQPGLVADPIRRADIAECIDKLRSYVAQTYLARGATTVAVTSPVGDEGKSFTAFGLANSLARSGYKTLLVDFDLRTPTLHALAGVDNANGVCELLRGETDPRTAVLGLPDGLWFLPAGTWSDAARQAAVGSRLESLIAKLKQPFDCVVLHGHALLTVAETVEIARRSEAVLLCTLYRESKVPLLQKAADRLAAMEVPFTGVVYLGATPHEALC